MAAMQHVAWEQKRRVTQHTDDAHASHRSRVLHRLSGNRCAVLDVGGNSAFRNNPDSMRQ
jgi:hypothetical protein